jgi:hypothetical protein
MNTTAATPTGDHVMQKTLSFVLASFLVLALVPAVAAAKDKTGSFGIGYDSTLAGVGGVSARYQIAKNFGVQAVLGFDQQSFDTKDDNDETVASNSFRTLGLALRGDVGIAFTKKTNMSVIFGVDVFNGAISIDPTADGADSTDESDTRFAFEIGLKAEYFFTGYFSVHCEVGLVFALANKQSELTIGNTNPLGGVADADVSGFVLSFGRGDTFGGAGFTFWFN